jgi:hypothetical protein
MNKLSCTQVKDIENNVYILKIGEADSDILPYSESLIKKKTTIPIG